MVFGNGVKNIQAAAYNGAHTVVEKGWLVQMNSHNLDFSIFLDAPFLNLK